MNELDRQMLAGILIPFSLVSDILVAVPAVAVISHNSQIIGKCSILPFKIPHRFSIEIYHIAGNGRQSFRHHH